jgi:predicted ferric reductase
MTNSKKYNIDKWGTSGLFLTALLSPCCFPVVAYFAATLGLGSFGFFGGWTMWLFQAMVVVTILGLFISYRKHRCIYPLTVALTSGLLIFYSYHFSESTYWTYFIYIGMVGLLIATLWNYRRNKLHGDCSSYVLYNGKSVELKSTITCPSCGHKKTETMPTDACQFFYECENCKTQLKPLPGDCCVYCSYGTVKCPSIQAGDDCC